MPTVAAVHLYGGISAIAVIGVLNHQRLQCARQRSYPRKLTPMAAYYFSLWQYPTRSRRTRARKRTFDLALALL
jgi:hypothetical protein